MKFRQLTTCATIVVIIAVNCIVHAQPHVDAFLLSALEDREVSLIDEQLQYLYTKPYRLAPIKRMEFRTESNQLDPARQDYALRINPANPWEIRSSNKYFQEYKSYLGVKKDLALKEALEDRYRLLVEILYNRDLQALKSEESSLMDRYISVLENLQESASFDDKDYVDLKLDQVSQSVELEEVAFELQNVLFKIRNMYPSATDDFISADFPVIPIEKLLLICDSLRHTAPSPLVSQYYEQRVNLATRAYTLERNNINFGFLQAQYQKFRIEQDRNPWSVSMGVTIPIFNPNKGDMTKKKMDVFEATQEKQKEVQEFETNSAFQFQQMKSQVLQYQATREKIDQLKKSSLASTLATRYNDNPALQIRFNTDVLKLEAITIKLKRSILLTYIDVLSSYDVLHQQPLINYLSPGLRHLSR